MRLFLSVMCWFVLVFLVSISQISAGITPQNVAVIANTHPDFGGVSESVAEYYCTMRGIPLSNIIRIETRTSDSITQSQYVTLVSQIRSQLISQLHVNPSDPANDPVDWTVTENTSFAPGILFEDCGPFCIIKLATSIRSKPILNLKAT